MNRNKYIAFKPFLSVKIGDILQHREVVSVQGMVSGISNTGTITMVYGRIGDNKIGIMGKFIRASDFENMTDGDESEFENIELLNHAFVVKKYYE